MARKEFRFLTSVRVPERRWLAPGAVLGRTDTLASKRITPFSMSPLFTPQIAQDVAQGLAVERGQPRRSACPARRRSPAAAHRRGSGPPGNRACRRASTCVSLPVSSSRCTRRTRTICSPSAVLNDQPAVHCQRALRTGRSDSPWAGRGRSSSCGRRCWSAGPRTPSARATWMAYSTAFWFTTGRVPGMPAQTGQTAVLGAARVLSTTAQLQNIFECVCSSA